LLYNAEQKIRFLEQFPLETQKLYHGFFKACYKTERHYQKDLCMFNNDEFQTLLHSFMSTSLASLKVRTSVIRTYIDFCINNGEAETPDGNPLHINVADTFPAHTLDKFVRPDAKKKKFLVDGELDDFIGFCYNAQDAVVPQLLREGVRGHNLAEICKLHEKNIDFITGMVTLYDIDECTRIIKVSPNTLDLIRDALDQDVYYSKNSEETRSGNKRSKLNESGYVIRSTQRREANDMVRPSIIQGRIRRLSRQYGNCFITIHTLFVSGQIEYGKMLKKRDGVEELTTTHYEEICERFGLPKDHAFPIKYAIQKYL
jgi:integrase